LHGFVRDSAGAALRGVFVAARTGQQFESTKTATDGSYTIPVNAGVYEVEVAAEAPSYLHETLQSNAYIEQMSVTGNTIEDFSLPAEAKIAPQLLNSDEQPVGGARICLSQNISEPHSTTTQGTPVEYSGRASNCGETDDNGKVPLYGFVDGPATVTTFKAKELSFSTEAVPMSAGTPLTISFPAYVGRLRGTVRDSTGAPLRGVFVQANTGARTATAATAADGSYTLALPLGAYEIVVEAEQPSYLRESLRSEADMEEVPVSEDTVEDLALPSEGRIDAQVLKPNAQPVGGAQTCISQNISEPHSSTPEGTPVAYSGRAFECGTTDETGSYRLYGFIDGPATVSARKAPKETPVTASATPGSATSLTLYLEPPIISKLATRKGPAAGGTSVLITGLSFSNASTVSFGGVEAASFQVNSSTSITAISPPSTSGQVDVTVTTGDGSSAITNKDRYKYEKPTVTSVSPSAGPASGGTIVTVIGSGFAPGSEGTAFNFKAAKATAVQCTSTTECTVTTPPGKQGTVDVLATSGRSKSKKSATDRYSYS
jgi:hypothetical protein